MLIQIMAERRSDHVARESDGRTALTSALHARCLDVVRRLLERCVDVNRADRRGYTPLQLAARLGDSEIVLALLDRGADVNAVGWHGYTALIDAARSLRPAHSAIARMLLDHGADPGWQGHDVQGHTVVGFATLEHRTGRDGNGQLIEVLQGQATFKDVQTGAVNTGEIYLWRPLTQKVDGGDSGDGSGDDSSGSDDGSGDDPFGDDPGTGIG